MSGYLQKIRDAYGSVITDEDPMSSYDVRPSDPHAHDERVRRFAAIHNSVIVKAFAQATGQDRMSAFESANQPTLRDVEVDLLAELLRGRDVDRAELDMVLLEARRQRAQVIDARKGRS